MAKPALPIDSWREIPPIPANGYLGMTELSAGGRFFQMSGVGTVVRKRLERFAARKMAGTV